MKVLHVISGLAPGGAEEQLRLLLPHTRHDASVVSLTGIGSVGRRIADSGVPVQALHMRSNRDLRALGRLVRLMRAERYDVVHAHLYRGLVYGRPAARLARVPVVLGTEHSIGETLMEGVAVTPAVRFLYRATRARGTTTVAVSSTARDRLLAWGIPASTIEVVPNGLDAAQLTEALAKRDAVRAELDLPPEAVLLGVVGRLEASKAVDEVIEATAPLLGSTTRLLVVGEGRSRPALEAQAARLGVADWVRFTGESNDVPRLLAALDVSVNASVTETFGLAMVEALLSGLPVIYRTCPAIDDLPGPLPPGAVRVGSTLSELREAVRGVLAAGARRHLPDAELLLRYDIRSVAERLDGLYDRLAESRHAGLHRRRGNPL